MVSGYGFFIRSLCINLASQNWWQSYNIYFHFIPCHLQIMRQSIAESMNPVLCARGAVLKQIYYDLSLTSLKYYILIICSVFPPYTERFLTVEPWKSFENFSFHSFIFCMFIKNSSPVSRAKDSWAGDRRSISVIQPI